MKPSDPVPSFVFDTSALPERDRYAMWQAQISPLFDITPVRDDCIVNAPAPTDFSARLEGFHLGPLLFGRTTTLAQTYSRCARRVARDGLDHFMVQGFLAGGGPLADGSGRIAPGDMIVVDFAQAHSRPAEAMDTLSLIIPRDLNPALSRALAALHERRLPRESPLVRLLFDLMQSTFLNVPSMSLREANGVRDAVVGLLTNGLDAAGAEMAPMPEQDVAFRFAIRRHIEDRLHLPLDIPALLQAFPISRSSLYRMFEAEGGVRRYILTRRLRRALYMLRSPEQAHLGISDIAFACGFSSASHFNRSFRDQYGLTPRELRAQPDTPAPVHGDRLADWLGAL